MEDETFDSEEDTLPADILILRREVTVDISGDRVVLEAHVTKHQGQDDGITWIKMYDLGRPEKFSHCYIDTINGELILDAMENYIRGGRMTEVADFLREDGRAIRNPVTFRLKLESALGGSGSHVDTNDLF